MTLFARLRRRADFVMRDVPVRGPPVRRGASDLRRRIPPCAAACLLVACSTLPDIRREPSVKAAPILASADGMLSAERSQAVLEAIDRRSGGSDILKKHVAVEEAITATPMVVGNRVTLLQDGPATYKAMYAALRAARDNVNLQTYIFEDDEVGRQMADLLIEKQKQGVQVNVLYDSVGSISTPREFFQRLRDQGIRVLEFNPVNPLEAKGKWLINQRDHRKLLIVDGRTAFTGGINFSGVYSSGSLRRPSTRPASGDALWRDTHVRIDGPVVAEFQKLFLASWEKQQGSPLPQRSYFPELNAQGNHIVRAVGSTPDARTSVLYLTLMSAIRNADYAIHLTNAYFVPDPQLVAELKNAARRGVDVKLILPSRSDFWAPLYAGRSHYSELLAAGVRIFERRNALLHAKTGVVDGVWSMVGSSNLDWRSFLHNDELDAVVLGTDFGREMEAAFESDLAESEEIHPQQWARRPLDGRLREFAARLWEYWL
jgi:cardiolipin synthase A/B